MGFCKRLLFLEPKKVKTPKFCVVFFLYISLYILCCSFVCWAQWGLAATFDLAAFQLSMIALVELIRYFANQNNNELN